MAITVRLNDWEQEEIRKKAVEINKKLIEKNKQPIRDSQLVHEILEQCIKRIEVTKSGDIIIE